jgi:GT2 family glycosyltransferase
MPGQMNEISLVVATKDRPDDLRKLLESLRAQTARPAEIVVVDSSNTPVEPVTGEFPELSIRYLRHWPPSAAAQRNAGILACNSKTALIGFADDDTTFEPQAFANMLHFWEITSPDVLGVAFNIRNLPKRGHEALKRGWLAERMGLYSAKPGSVSPSGWQTVTGEVSDTLFVEWLPSGASGFRREVFRASVFDEFFQGYSYLEDLDFSYSISRRGRLAIVANAGFSHFPSAGARVSARQFGRYEIRNRLYFVRKHKLSVIRCYMCLAIRFAMSIMSGLLTRDSSQLLRAFGNLEELGRRGATSPMNAQPAS